MCFCCKSGLPKHQSPWRCLKTVFSASENSNLLACMSIAQWMRTWPKLNEVSQLPLEDEFLWQSSLLHSFISLGDSLWWEYPSEKVDVGWSWMSGWPVTLMLENWYIPEFTRFFLTPNAINASNINHLYFDLWKVSSRKQWKPSNSRAGWRRTMEAKNVSFKRSYYKAFFLVKHHSPKHHYTDTQTVQQVLLTLGLHLYNLQHF